MTFDFTTLPKPGYTKRRFQHDPDRPRRFPDPAPASTCRLCQQQIGDAVYVRHYGYVHLTCWQQAYPALAAKDAQTRNQMEMNMLQQIESIPDAIHIASHKNKIDMAYALVTLLWSSNDEKLFDMASEKIQEGLYSAITMDAQNEPMRPGIEDALNRTATLNGMCEQRDQLSKILFGTSQKLKALLDDAELNDTETKSHALS